MGQTRKHDKRYKNRSYTKRNTHTKLVIEYRNHITGPMYWSPVSTEKAVELDRRFPHSFILSEEEEDARWMKDVCEKGKKIKK